MEFTIGTVIDVENLDAGQDFKELPDVYVIFVTEKDLFKDGAGVHRIRRTDESTGKPFGDGSHILYVNGKYRGNDDLGKLIHDFDCSRAADMVFPLMAEQTRYFKENPEGVAQMCKMMEDMRKESKMEEKRETAYILADKGFQPTEISEIVRTKVETVCQWLESRSLMAK